MATNHILTEAEKEAIYDAQRDGSYYRTPEPADDTPLSLAEAQAIAALYPSLSPVWQQILDIICNPEDDGSEPEDTDEIIRILSGK